jgi:hypothetical protein
MARTLESSGEVVPRPPKLRPTWTTWMWLAFAVAVVVLTILGLSYAGGPY